MYSGTTCSGTSSPFGTPPSFGCMQSGSSSYKSTCVLSGTPPAPGTGLTATLFFGSTCAGSAFLARIPTTSFGIGNTIYTCTNAGTLQVNGSTASSNPLCVTGATTSTTQLSCVAGGGPTCSVSSPCWVTYDAFSDASCTTQIARRMVITTSQPTILSGCNNFGTGLWLKMSLGTTAPTVSSISVGSGAVQGFYSSSTCSAASLVGMFAQSSSACWSNPGSSTSSSNKIMSCSSAGLEVMTYSSSSSCSSGGTTTTRPLSCQADPDSPGSFTMFTCANSGPVCSASSPCWVTSNLFSDASCTQAVGRQVETITTSRSYSPGCVSGGSGQFVITTVNTTAPTVTSAAYSDGFVIGTYSSSTCSAASLTGMTVISASCRPSGSSSSKMASCSSAGLVSTSYSSSTTCSGTGVTSSTTSTQMTCQPGSTSGSFVMTSCIGPFTLKASGAPAISAGLAAAAAAALAAIVALNA